MTTKPTPDQIRATSRALAWIRSYDASFPRADEAMTLAWSRAFAKHKLTAQDLEAGIDRYFADTMRSRNRVLPADIIRTSRDARRDQAEREATQQALAPGNPAADSRRREIVARAVKELAERKGLPA